MAPSKYKKPVRFAPRAIALAVGLSLAQYALAQSPAAPGRVDPARVDPARGGIGLKLQSELLPAEEPAPGEELPVFLESDTMEGVQGKYLEAYGDVVVRRRGQQLLADRIVYDQLTDTVNAKGNVRFRRLGDTVVGDEATYNLERDTGTMANSSYRLSDPGGRGTAKRIKLRDRDRFQAEKATYTNCDVGDDDWYLKVNRLDIDRLADVGVARNATVYFKGVPVLYSPWLDFSLSGRRKSGFLAPTLGTTNNSGFELSLPYYWNIAPNRDYTITPRFLARRGLMVNNEFRYLEPSYHGDLRVDVLPNDALADRSRWAYSFRHQQSITSRLSGNINVQGVSDDRFFVDLSDKIAKTSQTNLPREGSLYYNGDWWSLFGRVQSYQTLEDLGVPVDSPYKRLPQIVLRAAQQNLYGFDARLFGEVTNFSHPDKQSGIRQVYYPTVEYRFGTPFVYMTPKFGVNYSIYSLRDQGADSQTRTVPIFSIDSGMRFIRDGSFFGRKLDQTLEPRLYYVYIPYRKQDQLPVFDTSLADFNLAQIFTENRYTGWDRINDANQITAAATTRLIEPNSGRELLRATLGQRYYFTEQRVALDANDVRTSNRSDTLVAVTGALSHNWWLDFGLEYNLDDGESKRLNGAVRYQPQPGKVFNVGYRYTRNVLEQVDVSAQWPLYRGLSALARWNYSIQDRTLVEALGGLEYNGGCWAVRGVLHSFVTAADKRSNGFFVQFELSGMSRGVGSNPAQVLGRSITGYQRSQLRSITAEDYFPGMEAE